MAFEGGQLVNDYHVVSPGNAALLNEPLHILSIDDVDKGVLHEGRTAFRRSAHSDRVGQAMEMIPFFYLCRPGVSRNAQRSNHQHTADFESIKAQLEECRQRDDAFAKPHFQKDSCCRILDDEVGRIPLVFMRLIFHRAHLRSVLSRQ